MAQAHSAGHIVNGVFRRPFNVMDGARCYVLRATQKPVLIAPAVMAAATILKRRPLPLRSEKLDLFSRHIAPAPAIRQTLPLVNVPSHVLPISVSARDSIAWPT
jgi:hypothetical protein